MAHKAFAAINVVCNCSDTTSWEYSVIDGDFVFKKGDGFVRLINITCLNYEYKINNSDVELTVYFGQGVVFRFSEVRGVISVYSDQNGSLPLFYFNCSNRIYMATDFIEFIQMIPAESLPKLNVSNMVNYILLDNDPFEETLLDSVNILKENERLDFYDGIVTISNRVKVVDQIITHPIKSSDIDYLIDYFHSLLSIEIGSINKGGLGSNAGATLSMGFDSSIVAQCLLGNVNSGSNLFGVISDDTKSQSQLQLSNEFVSRFGGNLTIINPYAEPDKFLSGKYSVNPYTDIYSEAFSTLATEANDLSVSLILEGYGGDEYFRWSNKLKSRRSESSMLLSIFKDENLIKNTQNEAVTDFNTLLPRSVRQSNLYSNHLWHANNIWVNNPLCSPAIISFGLQVPKEYKKNKYFLKYYCQKYDFPGGIQQPENKFTFTNLFRYYFNSNREKMIEIIENSYLDQLGVIDKKKVQYLLNNASEGEYLNIYAIITLELFVSYYQSLHEIKRA